MFIELLIAASVLGFVALLLGLSTLTISKSLGGTVIPSVSENVTVTDNVGIQANPVVIAAQPAVLTVRTNNTSGSLTMNNSNHGIITGQRVDLYWTGGQCYGAVVGTVAGSVVPIASVSGGSVLPSASTAINVGIPVSSAFPLTGNNLSGLGLFAPVSGYFVFNNGSIDVYAAYVQAGRTFTWDTNSVGANPLATFVPTVVWMSQNSLASVPNMIAAAVTH